MAFSVDLTIPNLVLFGVLAFIGKHLWKVFQEWRFEKMLKKWEGVHQDKVILHTIFRGITIPSPSPFGLKLETYLRMAKIPYELETNDSIGAKGKLPWISYNGQHVADSHLIIQFLNKLGKLSVDLNKKTTKEQVAKAKVCRIMLEEHFFWGMDQNRLMEKDSTVFQVMKIPAVFKYLLPIQAYIIKKRMDNQGMGLHTPAEIYQMTEDDLHIVSSILGNNKFLGGDEPCEDDCGVFGMIAQAVWGMPESSYERLVHGELSILKEYCERMKDLYWPDWESLLDKW